MTYAGPEWMLTALELFMCFDYVLPGGGAGGGVQKKGGAVVLGRWLTLAKKNMWKRGSLGARCCSLLLR